jgi:hypothetical protein
MQILIYLYKPRNIYITNNKRFSYKQKLLSITNVIMKWLPLSLKLYMYLINNFPHKVRYISHNTFKEKNTKQINIFILIWFKFCSFLFLFFFKVYNGPLFRFIIFYFYFYQIMTYFKEEKNQLSPLSYFNVCEWTIFG